MADGLYDGASPLSGLARLRNARSKRESSYDRTGANKDCIPIAPGEKVTIADIKGAGCIRHIWSTQASDEEHYLRKIILRMWWDGEEHPSVECPIGDFFGVGHAIANHWVSLPLNMIRQQGRGTQAGMNCFFPMPFANGARIEVENQGEQKLNAFFYYIDYEEYDSLEGDYGRFHCQWRRENPCEAVKWPKKPGELLADSANECNVTGDDNYVILDAEGRGHYAGCVLHVDNTGAFTQNYTWLGEGDDMIFIDGEQWPPSLHGTGTEDYFCSAWCYPMGEYSAPYHGISLAGDPIECSGKWSQYRFHIEDPVHFKKSLRVTIEHGHGNNQGNDYSSSAYWYQAEPHKPFPSLLPVAERLPNKRYR